MLSDRRRKLQRAGTLHWLHWVVVLLSLLVTIAAWRFSSLQVAERTESKFEREARHVLDLVRERMRKYEDALWSGVSAIHASGGSMTHEQWVTFANSLAIETKYPGINGIGVIHHVPPGRLDSFLEEQRLTRPEFRIHPQHDESEYLPITYIEPVASNAEAVGLDMAHEAHRYTAAQRSRDTGTASITGPIVLVQDAGRTPGFLFYAPFFANPEDAKVDRERSFQGMVYAPFVVENLMLGTLEKNRRHVGIRISDSGETIYDEHHPSESDFDPGPLFQASHELDLYGRRWTFDIRSTKSFREESSASLPLVILFGGLSIDALLFLLFFLLSRRSRHALSLADDMTRELSMQSIALEESNSELEKFAYVASHDLKTPLRGIGDLVEYLEEDLEKYLASPDSDPEVKRHLDRIQVQVERMNQLIAGILEYSRIGGEEPLVKETNLREFAQSLTHDLGLRDDQLSLTCEPSCVDGGVYLEQVLLNLVTNAVKHNDDRETATVSIDVRKEGEDLFLRVTDNGPGIEPNYHERIFGVFQTLKPRDHTDNTGIGLSIVRKIVERRGGTIGIESQVGRGTTFMVRWPLVPAEQRRPILTS